MEKKIRNPNWARDEVILALDLYYRSDYNKLGKEHPDVIQLSQILNKLPIHPLTKRAKTFRNPKGVYMKLGNLLHLDTDDDRIGLPSYGSMDKLVMEDFKNQKEVLHDIALSIRQIVNDNKLLSALLMIPNEIEVDEENVNEGKVFYKLHKLRERNSKIIRNKKKTTLQKLGKLECEVCGFDFYKKYGQLGFGFIECHHKKPLSLMKPNDRTTPKDLALVCSNCHRMLHRDINNLSIHNLKDKLNSA